MHRDLMHGLVRRALRLSENEQQRVLSVHQSTPR
jgi:hypothetical protein